MNRRGEFGLRTVMYAGLGVGALMFAVFLFSTLAPIVTTTFGAFGDVIKNTPDILSYADSPAVNGSTIVTQTVDSSESAVNQANYIPYVLLAVGVICLIVFGVNVRVHPILLPLWFLLMFVIVLISMPLSNSYSYLSANNPSIYGSADNLTNLYMTNLPIVFTVLGLLGGVFMFILIQKEPEFEQALQ